jgi:hypothetical protein
MVDQTCTPLFLLSVHVAPKSPDVQMYPLYAVAASFMPSEEDAIDVHPWAVLFTCSIHVSPESLDVQI